jgi:hypothetical protein
MYIFGKLDPNGDPKEYLFDNLMLVVFLWFPTLQQIVPDGILPSGLVFSSFMLCISIGGKFFEIFRQRVSEETFAILLCLCSCLGLSASIVSIYSQLPLFNITMYTYVQYMLDMDSSQMNIGLFCMVFSYLKLVLGRFFHVVRLYEVEFFLIKILAQC